MMSAVCDQLVMVDRVALRTSFAREFGCRFRFRFWFRFWWRWRLNYRLRCNYGLCFLRRLFLNSLLDACKPLAAFFIRVHLWFRRLFCADFKKIDGQPASLCPLDRIEPKIVAQSRIRAGFHQLSHEIRVTEDDGKDQRCLSAVISFVNVGSAGECGINRAGVAGSYRLSEWNCRTHSAAL